MSKCKMCNDRGKTWEGSNPICFFENAKQNWNCATINALRNIVEPGFWEFTDDERVKYFCRNDQTTALIDIDDVELDEDVYNDSLVLSWYKSRGHTMTVALLDDGEFREPKEEECLAIIKHFRRKR